MSYKDPDRKAIRFRRSTYSIIDHKKFYDVFKKMYPQYKDVPNRTLGRIIRDFNGALRDVVIENRDGVELPESIGNVFIGVCPPPKKFNVDPKLSVEYNKALRYRNFDSDHHIAKICYTNYAGKYKFMHRQIWGFRPFRPFKKAVSEAFLRNWNKYQRLENLIAISHAFKDVIKFDRIKRLNAKNLLSYNEFQID